MKNFTFASVLILFLVTFSFAGTPVDKTLKAERSQKSTACTATEVTAFQSNIFQTSDGKVNVILIDSDSAPVQLRIHDSQNHRLYSEDVMENSVRHRFAMHELEPGSYTFTLSKNGECFTKTVIVK